MFFVPFLFLLYPKWPAHPIHVFFIYSVFLRRPCLKIIFGTSAPILTTLHPWRCHSCHPIRSPSGSFSTHISVFLFLFRVFTHSIFTYFSCLFVCFLTIFSQQFPFTRECKIDESVATESVILPALIAMGTIRRGLNSKYAGRTFVVLQEVSLLLLGSTGEVPEHVFFWWEHSFWIFYYYN